MESLLSRLRVSYIQMNIRFLVFLVGYFSLVVVTVSLVHALSEECLASFVVRPRRASVQSGYSLATPASTTCNYGRCAIVWRLGSD